MKSGKKIFGILMASTLGFLVGCGNKDNSSTPVIPSDNSNTSVSTSSNQGNSIDSTNSENTSGDRVYGAWEWVTRPSEESAGKAKHTATDGYVEEVNVPVLTDTTVWAVEVNEPTHFFSGSKTYTSIYGQIVVDVPPLPHTPGDNYEVIDNENGTISLVKTCTVDGEPVGEPVSSIKKKSGALFDINTSKANPFVVDSSNPNKYISATIGDGQASYLVLDVYHEGTIVIDYEISSEKTDKLFIKKGNTTTYLEVGGNSDDTVISGTIEIDAKGGDSIDIYYQKDNSTKYGLDKATVTIKGGTFDYKALNYNTNGGEEVTPSFIENGKLVGNLPEPTKENAYFEGWYVDEALKTPYTSLYRFNGDSVLYAKYSEPLKVTFVDPQGNKVKDDVLFKAGTTPSLGTNPVKAGFNFVGWYTDDDLLNAYVPSDSTESITLYAKFVSAENTNAFYGEYSGFYIKTGTTSSSSSSSSGGYGDEDGYYDDSVDVDDSSSSSTAKFAGQAYDNYADLTVDVNGNFSFRVYYSDVITGKLKGVNASGVVEFENDKDDSSYDASFFFYDKKADVLYIGVKVSASDTRVYVLSRTPFTSTYRDVKVDCINKNAPIIFANYVLGNQKKQIIMIDFNLGKVVNDVTIRKPNLDIIEANEITKQLYFKVFTGSVQLREYHYISEGEYGYDNDGLAGIYTNGEETLLLSGSGFLQYDKIGKSIYTYVKYTEVSNNEIYISYSAAYRLIITLDGANHTFTSRNRTVSVTFDYNYEENGINKTSSDTWLYDIWTDIEDENPTREGYTFDGWYINNEGTAKDRASLTSDTTFVARWLVNHTVSFKDTNDAKVYDDIIVPDGRTFELPVINESERYLLGWFSDIECHDKYEDDPITGNITLYGKWYDNNPAAGSYIGYNLGRGVGYYETSSGSANRTLVIDGRANISGNNVFAGGVLHEYSGNTVCVIAKDQVEYGAYFINTKTDHVLAVFPDTSTYMKTIEEANYDPYSQDNVLFIRATQARFTQINPVAGVAIVKIEAPGKNIYLMIDTRSYPFGATYRDVKFKDANGEDISFADIYSDGSFIDEFTVEGDNSSTGFKKNPVDGKMYIKNKNNPGEYQINLDGKDVTLTLADYDFESFIVENEVKTSIMPTISFIGTQPGETYADVQFTYNNKNYTFIYNLNTHKYEQVLDGFEGSYTLNNGTIVITGYGDMKTPSGDYLGTYEIISDTYLKLTYKDNTEEMVRVDKTDMRFIQANMSIFSGYTFRGTYLEKDFQDNKYTTNMLRIVFDSSTEIEGTIYAVNESDSYYFKFTGTFDKTTNKLTLTIGQNIFGSSLENKTLILTLSDKTFTVTDEGTFRSNVYTFYDHGSATCDSFVMA